ncbi:MAG: PepSY domain-containing protein [Candidatus Thermoplasmatota archaeon]|nr:PepSY domain-containing protein [Candidatus Thermoplasmatota archaeon]
MKLAFNIEDFNITMAKQEKDQTNEREVWRYNIEFNSGGKQSKAMIEINANTGDVILFQRESQWRL